jgi:myo-inositol-1(or 4)-monophosphatase
MTRRSASGFTLDDFSKGIENYDGPCFAVGSAGGAAAFERGLFDVCVSIAYLDGRRLQAAVVYDPVHVELFHAVSGLGAYLNGKRISPAQTKRISDACVSLDQTSLRAGGESVRMLLDEAAQVRVGAACGIELCYTACGRVDATIRHNEAFFDYAAGMLVAKEAGATVSDSEGADFSEFGRYGERLGVTVSCPSVAQELLTGLRKGR